MAVGHLALLFATMTQQVNLPTGLLSALCYVESSHKINAINYEDGGADSIGVCQIKLDTAKTLGFNGSVEDLMRPKTNIRYAALYLKKQVRRYSGDVYKAVAAYNAGKFISRAGSSKAVNKKYVDKVLKSWSEGR